MSFNKIIVVGNLGRSPELRYTPQGTPVCSFSLATNERETRNGEKQDVTTWFDVTLFGRQAEVASQYLAKGKQVYIEGRFRSEEWTDRDGNKRVTNKIKGSDMQLIDRVQGGEQSMSAAAGAGASGGGASAAEGAGEGNDEIDF
jgi:single-strand DNA-binding protein